MSCVADTDTLHLEIDAGEMHGDVKISADIGNGLSIRSDGLFVTDGSPIGSMVLWGGTEAPIGWDLCNGAEFNRSSESELFDEIGTFFGPGDGSVTANLPDFRGRVPVGWGDTAGHTDVSIIGGNEGPISLADRRSRHNSSPHLTLPDHVHGAGAGDWVYFDSNSPGTFSFGDLVDAGQEDRRNITGNPTTHPAIDGYIGPGGGAAVDTPAYLVVNVIIKTGSGGD